MIKNFEYPIGDVPDLTTEQMIEVDSAMIKDYGIELIQMMENAGRKLAHLARQRFLAGDPSGKHVVVLAGRGGNGGGALVCARRLANWGGTVEIRLSRSPGDFKGAPAQQLDILSGMQLAVFAPRLTAFFADSSNIDLIVDGLIGYSLSGSPRGSSAEMIRWANSQRAPILAVDVPSGMDKGTGQVFDPAIYAAATLTLAPSKQGLRSRRSHVGELYLADISVPPVLYEQSLVLEVGPLFASSDVVRLR